MLEQANMDAVLPASGRNGRARQQACAAAAAQAVQPASAVRYQSRGRLVIIGRGERARPLAAGLVDRLARVLVIVPPEEAADDADWPAGVERLQADVVRVEGYLGAFTIVMQGADGEVDLARLFPDQPPHGDLVLDLGDAPLLDRPLVPPGYFAPGGDPAALARALDEIPGLVGEFDKPQFFQYHASVCAHGRSGITACTRCIDACPTVAIRSIGEQIEVDPYLCQGAGSCATACPTGAITYNYPQPRDSLDRLRLLLRTYRQHGGQQAVLLIHDREAGSAALAAMAADAPEHLLPFDCEESGSTGMDIWLAALAYGAVAVVVMVPPDTPEPVLRELQRQVGFAQTILEGMGYAADAVRLLGVTESKAMVAELRTIGGRDAEQPAGFAGFNEKRAVIRLAVDHLHAHSPAPRLMVNLPVGAPFGEVSVDTGRCTLCMACVSQCPGKALLGGDGRPQLRFIEENCVQCSLCARSCPENAIAASPRYLYDREARSKVRTLYEEEPFLCVRCGKAFATRSTVDRITAKLRRHPMFQGDALRRIQMCEDCRVIDMMEEQGVTGGRVTPGVRS
ncbi:MAG: 4Fe-4S binding protein [Thiogranum sp.]